MPVPGLYLCGAGAHPGGGVTGAPGHNAAREIIRDLKGWRAATLEARPDMLKITDEIRSTSASSRSASCARPAPAARTSTRSSTAVELRFDVRASPSLPEGVRARARSARRAPAHRRRHPRHPRRPLPHPGAQPRRRARASRRARCARAAVAPKRRIPTKPTYASKERRHDGKMKRSRVKKLRSTRPDYRLSARRGRSPLTRRSCSAHSRRPLPLGEVKLERAAHTTPPLP